MDSRALDNYITSGRFSDCGQVPHVCAGGHIWTAGMFTEYGGGFYNDDDESVCPKCGGDGMTEDDVKQAQNKLKEFTKAVKEYHKLMEKFDDKVLKAERDNVAKLIKEKNQTMINNLPLAKVLELLQEALICRQENEMIDEGA